MAIEQHGDARVIRHALAQDALTTLRDVETDGPAFRDALVRLGRVCGGELADDVLGTEPVEVETPLTTTTGQRVVSEDVVVVTVLRAAVPFVEGVLTALPDARQGMLSASRNETAGMDGGTFPVDVAYEKLPAVDPTDTVVVADPMLATGSTMCAALERVHAAGDPARVLTLAAVSAPEGVGRVTDEFPETDVVTVAVDDGLNTEGFIVPGLGDAGDRAFRTT